MAKKSNTLLIALAAGAALFLAPKLLKGSSGSAARESDQENDQDESDTTSRPDAVIDIERTGQSVPQAIETARDIAQTVKDAAVIIKTPAGESNIAVTSGKKRGLFRKKKRKFSKAQIREMRKRAAQFCKSQPRKKRPSCRRNAIATMQRSGDIASAAMQTII